jgi:tRNA G46 methylase TrmB
LDWAAIKADAVVVDVGGGAGSLTLLLAKAFPHLKYVVQDLPTVMPESEKVIFDSVSLATNLHWHLNARLVLGNGISGLDRKRLRQSSRFVPPVRSIEPAGF